MNMKVKYSRILYRMLRMIPREQIQIQTQSTVTVTAVVAVVVLPQESYNLER
jgi:hypothetical protein